MKESLKERKLIFEGSFLPLTSSSWLVKLKTSNISPHVRESGIRNPANFCFWNPESWVLESGIQLKESGIAPMIGIQNPSSTDKDWNPVPGIRNPQRGIQNPRLSRIPLHWTKHCTSTRTEIIEHRIKKCDLTNGID